MHELYFCFTFYGDPIGKPRMTQRDKWLNPPRKPVAQWREFRDLFFYTAHGKGYRSDMVIRQVFIKAFIGFPRSWKLNQRRQFAGKPHYVTPDGDNILKAVCDSLTSQDSGIFRQFIEKFWDDGQGARLEVKIYAEDIE